MIDEKTKLLEEKSNKQITLENDIQNLLEKLSILEHTVNENNKQLSLRDNLIKDNQEKIKDEYNKNKKINSRITELNNNILQVENKNKEKDRIIENLNKNITEMEKEKNRNDIKINNYTEELRSNELVINEGNIAIDDLRLKNNLNQIKIQNLDEENNKIFEKELLGKNILEKNKASFEKCKSIMFKILKENAYLKGNTDVENTFSDIIDSKVYERQTVQVQALLTNYFMALTKAVSLLNKCSNK